MESFADWWYELSDPARVTLRNSAILIPAVIAAFVGNRVVRHLLVVKGVDKYLRLPWTTKDTAPDKATRHEPRRLEPSAVSSLLGWVFALSILGASCWWLAILYDAGALADMLWTVLVRGWEVTIVVFPALLISGWLARTLYELLHTPWLKNELDALFPTPPEGGGTFSETAARGLCIVIYAAFFLLIPVAIAGLFELSSLQGLVGPAWQICARLLTALIVFVVGYLGVAWARAQARRIGTDGEGEGQEKPPSPLGDQVGLGIVVATVILALGMLVGVSSIVGALVIASLLAFLLWPIRPYMRDLWAGLLLRYQNVKEVTIDNVARTVKAVGPLMAQLERDGEEYTQRNGEVLAAFVAGEKKETPAQ
jgi:hypothetical protein